MDQYHRVGLARPKRAAEFRQDRDCAVSGGEDKKGDIVGKS